VPLLVTLIVECADWGMAKAELAAEIPVPVAVRALATPVATLILPVLAPPQA